MPEHPQRVRRAESALSVFLNTDVDQGTRAAALNDRSIRAEVLEKFVSSLSPYKRASALNLCERPAVLASWARSGAQLERSVVAFNPHTPAEALRHLAEDVSPEVRMQLPFNPQTPADVLAQLVLDPSPEVQDAVSVAFDTETGHALRQGRRSAELGDDQDVWQ